VTPKAVILARGLGARMRRSDATATLDPDQRQAAETGMKGMIPVGRPLLDYTLSALAAAGFREVCLVIGPEHRRVRDYYAATPPRRIAVRFAVQERPAGTADAVLATEAFAGRDRFLVVNADNYYPVEACRALRLLDGAGLAAFASEDLVREGNLNAERVARFPVVEASPDGWLRTLGDGGAAPRLDRYVSMNCWMFTPTIFAACRAIAPSAAGELELPDAVHHAMTRLGERFRVLTFHAGVLDLTTRADIGRVAARLRDVEVDL
jgi:glucose-1-phosphate thymidylyltransferase